MAFCSFGFSVFGKAGSVNWRRHRKTQLLPRSLPVKEIKYIWVDEKQKSDTEVNHCIWQKYWSKEPVSMFAGCSPLWRSSNTVSRPSTILFLEFFFSPLLRQRFIYRLLNCKLKSQITRTWIPFGVSRVSWSDSCFFKTISGSTVTTWLLATWKRVKISSATGFFLCFWGFKTTKDLRETSQSQ